MKKGISSIIVALLVVVCTVDLTFAQPQRGEGRGPGMMRRGGNQGDAICDALLLDEKRAGEVEEIYEEIRTSMRENFSGENFREMSREDRMAAFQEMREKREAVLKEKLATVLSKEELKAVEPLLDSRGMRPVPEIRALRQIEIGNDTRGKLQTVVLAYFNTMASLRPEPGEFRGRGGMMSEDAREKMEAARQTLLADIPKVLSAEQVKAWKTETEKAEAELQSQRPSRGDRQPGQRPGRGQGRQR